jgi:ribosomal protein S18 acetylase RimI-like enzyme
MQSSFEVRSASDSDLPAVQRVAQESWTATYSGYIPDDDIQAFLDSNYSVDRLRQARTRIGDGFVVAAHEDRIIGYAMLSEDGDGNAQLWSIYVLPEFQGQGAGKLLWDAAVARARRLELPSLVLWVLASNSKARHFYERQGAVIAGHRDFAVGEGSVDEIGYSLSFS